MLDRIINYMEGLPPRTMLAVNLVYSFVAIAINLTLAYAIWQAYVAFWAVSTGWAAVGLIWALLTGAATLLANLAKLIFRLPSSITQYRDETSRSVVGGKYRTLP